MIPINSNLEPLRRSGIRLFTNLARQTPDCRHGAEAPLKAIKLRPTGRSRRFAAAKPAGQRVFARHMSVQKHPIETCLCYRRHV